MFFLNNSLELVSVIYEPYQYFFLIFIIKMQTFEKNFETLMSSLKIDLCPTMNNYRNILK